MRPFLFTPLLRCSLILTTLAFLGLAVPAHARFAQPTDAPVDRLVTNLTAYLKEHPDDPDAFYTLARVHLMALSLKSETIGTYGTDVTKDTKPTIPDLLNSPKEGAQMKPESMRAHTIAAIENYVKAIQLSPKNGLYYLGLANALERGAEVAPLIGLPPGQEGPATRNTLDAAQAKAVEALVARLGAPDVKDREAAESELRYSPSRVMPLVIAHRNDTDLEIRARVAVLTADHWRTLAIDAYRQAYDLSVDQDAKLPEQPIHGIESLVSFEAGKAYARLLEKRNQTDPQKEKIASISAQLAAYAQKQPGPITPIIFSLDRPAALSDLIDSHKRVRFDLDGTGRDQTWPWVRPEACILVWDPNHTGKITSGRQLFGSVTFWMFWKDGYRALDALDNDRDGWLRGDELPGLAIWRDANGDGICQGGEVTPIEQTEVEALRVTSDSREGLSPASRGGMRLRNGRTLPTYDWVAQPAH